MRVLRQQSCYVFINGSKIEDVTDFPGTRYFIEVTLLLFKISRIQSKRSWIGAKKKRICFVNSFSKSSEFFQSTFLLLCLCFDVWTARNLNFQFLRFRMMNSSVPTVVVQNAIDDHNKSLDNTELWHRGQSTEDLMKVIQTLQLDNKLSVSVFCWIGVIDCLNNWLSIHFPNIWFSINTLPQFPTPNSLSLNEYWIQV